MIGKQIKMNQEIGTLTYCLQGINWLAVNTPISFLIFAICIFIHVCFVYSIIWKVEFHLTMAFWYKIKHSTTLAGEIMISSCHTFSKDNYRAIIDMLRCIFFISTKYWTKYPAIPECSKHSLWRNGRLQDYYPRRHYSVPSSHSQPHRQGKSIVTSMTLMICQDGLTQSSKGA